MALVVCLALIVLITAAVLAFFARATSNRVVEVSRVNRIKTEQLAQSATDYVIGNFVKEIAASSNNAAITTVGDFTIYQPLNGNKAVPERKIAASLSADTNFINLIRQSIPAVDTNASGNNSATASRNGRYIDASRWNAPALHIGTGFTSTNTLPNWIYLTANATPTNAASTDTIGRFAYNVYSEGGLLDINVAGYSSATVPSSVDIAALKNSLAGADLSKLGITQSTINDLVGFRNPQSTTATQYKQQTSAALRDGFINRTGPGYAHNLLTSRQDLIRYAKNSPDPELLKALPYLTTFTRMVNAPSFTPDPNRPAKDDAANPSLINTRVTTPFTRTDATLAQTGEPLIKHRFPLSRLVWITKNGPLAGITSQQIENSFGLTYSAANGGTWTYTKTGSGNRILNLAEVANAGREPNFFELLQASIVKGSLGKQIVPTDETAETQIFQIGANIIDQYDGNSFPTRVVFAGKAISGIEDLPYISRIVPQIYTVASTPAERHQAWYRVEVWNPHAPSASSEIPTEFRYMIGPGSVSVNIYDLSNNLVSAGTVRDVLNDFPDNQNGIIIPNSNPALFRVPYRVSNSFTTTYVISTGMNAYRSPEHPYNGFYVGDIVANVSVNREAEIVANSVPHQLQYKSPTSGDWIPYHTIQSVPSVRVRTNDVPGRPWNNFSMSHVAASDPRSDRFGLYKFYFPTSTALPASNQTIRPTEAAGMSSTQPNWFGSTIYPGLLTENFAGRSGDKTHYADPDGLVRRADGGYATGAIVNGGYPMSNPMSMPVTSASVPDRPVVLNRPFISVAEMGYASRGMPWKSLDFFTSESADSALLDLFSISEGPTTAAVAGCIDPNSPHEKVLEAIFSGASKAEGISDPPTGSMTSSLLAQSLRQTTSATPLLNRSDLVMRWIGDVNKIPANSQDTIIKQRREAPVRALAEVSNTRTWNLLIDLVAQAGKFSEPDNFVVQGEVRYWIHVALDRYTGRIVDQYIEPVLE
jgi:hypothetical protein